MKLNERNVESEPIVGIQAAVQCFHCKGKCRLPGGRYREQGEVINCPICNGRGYNLMAISIAELKKLLKE